MNTTENTSKPKLDPTKIVLRHGAHRPTGTITEETPMCFMEAVVLVGEPWSDHPKCACESFGFLRSVNDRLGNNDAQRTQLLSMLAYLEINHEPGTPEKVRAQLEELDDVERELWTRDQSPAAATAPREDDVDAPYGGGT